MNSMEGVSSNNDKNESTKTPGGISKSLLTPCRRIGLSRKWKKGGCSPFISPLSTQCSTAERKEDRESRKRKICDEIEDLQEKHEMSPSPIVTEQTLSTPQLCNNLDNNITTTPVRHAQLSRKKPKTFSLSLKTSQECKKEEKSSENELSGKLNFTSQEEILKQIFKEKCKEKEIKEKIEDKMLNPNKESSIEMITKPVKTKSKLSLKRSHSKGDCKDELKKQDKTERSHNQQQHTEKCPNLIKKCMIVIQNEILKTDNAKDSNAITLKTSQESDSESDIPLSMYNKNTTEVTLNIFNDDGFICKPTGKKKLKNLSIRKPNKNNSNALESSQASQSSEDDIEKKTILIRKSYEKVTKPLKAKSTGSITQKDIDDLRERIEMKRNLLIAKAMSVETEELRSLIKKWQKGCQDALIELMDLMRNKLPDQKNMDYAEILKSLKIPAELVGYDSENDCFVTPDDTNILFSAFKL